MTDKKDEALKLALEALEYISSHYMSLPKIGCMALAVVEEALAEQPAQRCSLCNYQHGHAIGCKNNPVDIALNKMAQNARELGLDYESSAGTQVSKVWWDGDKLMAKPIPLENIYKEPEQPAQQTIHCKHRRENNGVCPHHNLHCGWPKCNEPEQPAQQVLEHAPCQGMNCGITRTDQEHSMECQAEHAAAIAGGTFVKPAQQDIPKIGCVNHDCDKCKKAQQQEPAGAVYRYGKDSSGKPWHGVRWTASGLDLPDGTLIYTSPQPSKPLTEEEIEFIYADTGYNDIQMFARAIEAAHGIKEPA